jgi:hypothetical protein
MARWWAAALAAGLASSGTAAASATEMLTLDGGFFPDPRMVEALVVGEGPAAAQVRGCPGEVAADPALVVTLERASVPLRFFLTGDGLAGLVVASPDGIHHCAGLDAQGIAALRLGAAMDGDYEVWPAVTAAGQPVSVAIAVSELDLSPADLLPAGSGVDRDAPPAAGRHPLADEGALVLAIDLVGDDPASLAGPGCAGRLDASRPDVVLTLDDPAPALHFDVTADVDTTLVVIDPAGEVHCDDDSFGYDPSIAVTPAASGEYAVWVGLYGGGVGETARLTIGREASDRAEDDWSGDDMAGDWNPFVGREIESARAALDILLNELGLGAILTYAAIEEPGPEAVTLGGVVLQNPEDPAMRLAIGRLVLSDLDLQGLATPAGPSRFSLALEAVDYSTLAESLRALDVVPLPELGAAPTLTLAASLLPAATGEGRMALRLLGQIDQQIGLSMEIIARPPEGVGTVDAMALDSMLSEAVTFELRNWGYIGAFLRAQAEDEGKSLEDFMAEGRAELRQLFEPMREGSPAAAAHAALSAMLDDMDGPGLLRLEMQTNEPRGLDVLLEELSEADSLEDERLDFSISYSSGL